MRGDVHESKETSYAATLSMQSFRAIMAITVAHDLEKRQYDVVNALVNAPIGQKIFCYSPQGFERKINGTKTVLRLEKPLYGFKFSTFCWYDEFVSFLLDQELERVPGINYMFTNCYMNIIFYVDDIM